MQKNIVLFADGTGNSASKPFKTNVWRLYEALNLNEQDQVATFADGVGTSSFKPFEVIGLALGFGVKRRVVNLYKFLCLNYQPGDRIFVFGFSRGAFTARLLVGLVAKEGLVEFQSHEELDRFALAAYRAFRKEAFKTRLPWVVLTRNLRDGAVKLSNSLTGSPAYQKPLSGPRSSQEIKVAFLGVWDTVAAYGLPIDELTRAVNQWVWPMIFEKRHLLPCVEQARHALSLDDERRTFFPIPWHPTDEQGREIGPERLRQVWFAGVHSNVGGGYPDDRLAHVPLCWMIEEAKQAGLNFCADTVARYAAIASEDGRIYDSRSNLGFFYRYHPRDAQWIMNERPKDEAPPLNPVEPLVDWSVIARMAGGPDGYAPVSLPLQFRVRLPDGSDVPFIAPPAQVATLASAPDQSNAEAALDEMRRRQQAGADGRSERFEVVQDTVWWRRAVYYVLLFLVLVAACYPLWSSFVTSGPLARAEYGARPLLGLLTGPIALFMPGFAKPWVDAIAYGPAKAAILAAGIALFMWFSAFLRTRIADRARIAWASGRWQRDQTQFSKERSESHKRIATSATLMALVACLVAFLTGTSQAALLFGVTTLACFFISIGLAKENRMLTSSPLLRFARAVRTSPRMIALYNALRERWLPAAALTVTGLAAVVLLNKSSFEVASASGAFCSKDDPPNERVEQVKVPLKGTLDPTSMCWDTQWILLKGERYKITIDSHDLKDASVPSGAAGLNIWKPLAEFDTAAMLQVAAVPLRRWWGQPYFQLIARIGSHGADEQPATPIRLADPNAQHVSFLFTPRETGRLYLYLNDAVLGIPGLRDFFYLNNKGTAEVTIENASGY
ncbi:DUF2235 domain-containing protein [Ensifer sp.]|jgi:uncharacterized protein (DUF2235 family)|uniref:DUF2235 domain-containing protein n=1 Tax=Ensifer sp. TaxID=1872086 RepID=UPI002E143350|nr:DUF2235 domain-containing protein [Ensifer sp.]